jgi:predicted O-linked N-acetylglucosamine transferase (SPINDLY family)
MSKPRQQGTMPPQLQTAIEHHQAGRLQQAEAIYRKLPNNADALNLLGVVAYQTGRHEQAVESIRKAIRANPANPTYHFNLGLSYRGLDRMNDARMCYQKAVALNPRYVDAHNNLGVVLRDLGLLDEAVKCYHKALSLNLDYVEAYGNLGSALKDLGKFAEAAAYCRQALERNPNHVGALGNLGAALNELHLHEEAIACSRTALALDPNCVDAHNNLGAALKEQGKLEEAAVSYRAALALRPDWSVLHFNLGSLLATEGKADEAAACFSQALQIAPGFADASNSLGAVLLGQAKLQQATDLFQHALQSAATRAKALNNFGNALLYQGKLDEALATFEQALQAGADPTVTFSNLLFSHNYHPTLSAEKIFAVYQRWNEQLAVPLANSLPSPRNRPDPAARLKVGYLSGDFKNHSVIHFAGPLIENHDHSCVEIFCYHNSFSNDLQTKRIMAAADHWIPCRAMSDDELAGRIRSDGIDVLVDLSGHTSGNRLLVFARKPAPVQVSWMGFGYTTGLSAMDYFIGDDLFTPPGCESLFSETVYRLPCASWAYQPQAEAPPPGPLPARERGYVTFACVSTTTRIHAPLIEAWAAILRRLPQAHLRLDARNYGDANLRLQFEERFAALGVPASQLEIGFTSPVWEVYQNVDIVLDCFPHNSGTTTFEALWMGLPVVTLADRPSVGRMGASILTAIGKPEWIATSPADYIERAVALAQDVAGLELVRSSLRQAMRDSSLLDHPAFARAMEAAYRDMWQQWCSAQSGNTPWSLERAIEHHRAGRLQEAETIYGSMPDNPDALHLLGVIASQGGHHSLAVERITGAIGINPGQAGYYCNLGSAYQALNQLDDAITSYQQALTLSPDYALAHNNLGNALSDTGRSEEAIASFRRALAVQPDYADAHSNLGSVLRRVGRNDESVLSYQNAIAIAPGLAEAHFNLGNVLHAQMRFNAAIDSFLAALAIKPEMHMAHNNLGLVLKDIGKLDDALICFENALALEPDFVNANSNLLFCVNYHPTWSPERIFAAYQQWDARQAARFSANQPALLNSRDPQRRLKVGYLSADFRNHSVIHFAAPLIEHHDKSRVEVFCYYNEREHDVHTDRMVAAADHWVPCFYMSDDDLAARIRADGIDVLIDLSGHTLGNRLLVFARKPAPVQASWMGFGYSTGLNAMDYFISDALFTPPGAEALFSETLYRLPRASWSYQPQAAAPLPGLLPARERGYVTFVCVSTTVRIGAAVIEAWAAILRRLPEAHLRLDMRNFSDPDLRMEFEQKFAALGVPASRLEIGFTSPVWGVYQNVDIVLDCFPHNSGTTTFEALWMGLPVVSLADRPSVGRFGASILTAIGKPEWIATSPADYVERAVALAQDIAGLERTRASLRETMRSSPLLDHAGFARAMEAAYRDMWQQWCKRAPQHLPQADGRNDSGTEEILD